MNEVLHPQIALCRKKHIFDAQVRIDQRVTADLWLTVDGVAVSTPSALGLVARSLITALRPEVADPREVTEGACCDYARKQVRKTGEFWRVVCWLLLP